MPVPNVQCQGLPLGKTIPQEGRQDENKKDEEKEQYLFPGRRAGNLAPGLLRPIPFTSAPRTLAAPTYWHLSRRDPGRERLPASDAESIGRRSRLRLSRERGRSRFGRLNDMHLFFTRGGHGLLSGIKKRLSPLPETDHQDRAARPALHTDPFGGQAFLIHPIFLAAVFALDPHERPLP